MYTLLFVSVWLIILTYLAGYETMTRYSTLYLFVLFTSVGITYLMQWNLGRWLKRV